MGMGAKKPEQEIYLVSTKDLEYISQGLLKVVPKNSIGKVEFITDYSAHGVDYIIYFYKNNVTLYINKEDVRELLEIEKLLYLEELK